MVLLGRAWNRLQVIEFNVGFGGQFEGKVPSLRGVARSGSRLE